MTEAQAAVGMDRLPWLADEPKPRTKDRARDLLGWAIAAMLLIAGASYWLGKQSGGDAQPEPFSLPAPEQSTATVKLPEARTPPPPPEVRIAQPPEVRPVPAPTVSVPEPRVERPVRRIRSAPAARAKASPRQTSRRSVARKPVRKEAATPARRVASSRPQSMALWPSRQTSGAYGRLVQIGAFGSRYQAKLGWRRMTRAYPAVGRLPAVVVETRNSRGRRFYRFQIGTSSQAHSEVLCQWMQRIRFSCAVVGLPWKPKGVER